MATSGSKNVVISNTSSSSYNEHLVIAWSRNSYSVDNNTSNITVTLKAYSTYGSGAQPYNLVGNTVRLTVAGTQRVNNTNASIDFRGTSASSMTTLATWTGNVSHNTDGTLSLTVEGYINYADTETSHSGLPGAHTVSLTSSVDQIPRASSPTCPSTCQFGGTIKITTNRASSSFTHKLVFSCNSNTQTVTGVGASYTFTIPESWAPSSAETSTLTVTCTTYSGSTNLGSNTCSSTVSVPSNWIPSVTLSYTLADTSDDNEVLAKVTSVTLTASASAGTGATISSYSWSGDVSGSGTSKTHTPQSVGSCVYTVTVTDSRGRSTTKTVKLTAISAVSTFTKNKSSMYFGDSITITISRKKSSFTHNISYMVGSTSVASASANIETSKTKTIPLSSASAIPNANSATMVVRVTTKNGSATVGYSEQTVTIKVPTSSVPTFDNPTATGVDMFNSMILTKVSKVTVSATNGTASVGASIVSYTFSGQNLNQVVETSSASASVTSDIVTSSGTKQYTVVLTDSRGRTATKTVLVNITSYNLPTLTLTGHRCDSDGTANDFGAYGQMHYSGTWSSVTGNKWTLVLQKRIYNSGSSYSTVETISNQTGSIARDSSVFSANVDYSYQVKATLTDTVGKSATSIYILSTGRTELDIYKDQMVTFFKPATSSLRSSLNNPDTAVFFGADELYLNGDTYIPISGTDGLTSGWRKIDANIWKLFFTTTVGSSSSKTFQLDKLYKGLLVLNGARTQQRGIYLISNTSSLSVTVVTVFEASDFSVTGSTNGTLTIANNYSSASGYIMFLNSYGTVS